MLKSKEFFWFAENSIAPSIIVQALSALRRHPNVTIDFTTQHVHAAPSSAQSQIIRPLAGTHVGESTVDDTSEHHAEPQPGQSVIHPGMIELRIDGPTESSDADDHTNTHDEPRSFNHSVVSLNGSMDERSLIQPMDATESGSEGLVLVAPQLPSPPSVTVTDSSDPSQSPGPPQYSASDHREYQRNQSLAFSAAIGSSHALTESDPTVKHANTRLVTTTETTQPIVPSSSSDFSRNQTEVLLNPHTGKFDRELSKGVSMHDTLVLELFENGSHEMRDMNRAELHQYIKRGVTSSVAQQQANNQFARLTARDLRKLDDSFISATEPVILVRQNVVLINIEPLRVIVLRDRCLLLLPYGADDILSVVMDKLVDDSIAMNHDAQAAFEFRAIETILESVVRVLDQQFKTLQTKVLESLRRLRKVVSNACIFIVFAGPSFIQCMCFGFLCLRMFAFSPVSYHITTASQFSI